MKPQNFKWRDAAIASLFLFSLSDSVQAQIWAWKSLPDPRGEFIRLCAQQMVRRSTHPENVCQCLHDRALASVADPYLHDALMRGVSETGVPTIENAWIPETKLPLVNAAFNEIARPTLQCMFGPAD